MPPLIRVLQTLTIFFKHIVSLFYAKPEHLSQKKMYAMLRASDMMSATSISQ